LGCSRFDSRDPAKEEGVKKMLSSLVDLTSRLIGALRREEGQGLAEYALILGSIAAIAVLALVFIGSDITSLLSKVANDL
jgi:Flp pilus assembly pilin Flp